MLYVGLLHVKHIEEKIPLKQGLKRERVETKVRRPAD